MSGVNEKLATAYGIHKPYMVHIVNFEDLQLLNHIELERETLIKKIAN